MTKPEEKIRHNYTGTTQTPDLYGKEYFDKYGTDCGPIPYRRDEPRWLKFFGDVAEELNRSLKPCTVLDVGCAIGFLVEAFWRRGVRTYGIDISEYAISQVPEDLRLFCRALSATEPLPDDFPQTYDLITCIEVLEHLTAAEGRAAIENMASRTSCILFSSTPHDLTEPTHVNVRPIIYWLQLFAEVGFYPDLRFDASFVSPQAFLARKGTPRLQEDVLPFFSESINKKFQINAQQEQIVGLTQSKQEIQRQLEEEIRTRDKQIENLRGELGLLNQNQQELGETLRQERGVRQTLQGQVEALEREAGSLRSTAQQLAQEMNQLRMGQLEPLEREAEGLRSTAQQLAQEINQLQMVLSVKNLETTEQSRKIASLEMTQSGLFWELLVAYRGAKDRFFPLGSNRRALYNRLLAWVKASKFIGQDRHPNLALVEAKRETTLGVDRLVPIARSLRKFGLIISGCPGDAFRYRCEHQAEQLRFFGLTVETAYFDQVDYRAALEQYQCYWLHRVPHTEVVEDFIRTAQLMGKPVIFDTDDLIFDEEKIAYIRALQWMSEDELGLYHDGVRRYYRTLSLCRFATVTTEPLRDAIQRLFPQTPCFINPNTLSDAQLALADDALKLSRPTEDQEVIRIAYLSGTHTHNVDFQECAGALQRILEANPGVRLMLVGHLDVGSEFERFRDRIERYPLLPWQELPRLFRKIDINLAPLELINPFTEAKSALKYFEAAVMGVPTVASDVEAFRTSIRDGENGYLCRTEEEWVRCLSNLVQDERLRRELGSLARKEVLENCTTRAGAPRLISLSREIVQKSPSSSKRRLSIAFILRAPIAQVGGGYKNIFRLAHYLANQDHDVNVYVEPIAHLEGKNRSEIVDFCHRYFGKSPAQIHIGHDDIKTCDVAVATNWPTAFVVDCLTNAICKAYLIQDFEPEFYEHENPLYKKAEKTYALPLKKITLGRHLANLFERKDRLPVAYIDFGIDHGIFNAQRRKKPENKISILFFARPALKRRGYETGIAALNRVYEIYPEVEIFCYGMEEKKALPFPYTNLGILSPAELAQAMCNSDIHLSFSLTNISYVPFEAMACGCAVVEAKVRSVEAMVGDGAHCLLAEPKADAVAEALSRLIADKRLRERVAKAGVDFVHDKTWDNSCKQFEDILCDSLFIDPKVPKEITPSPLVKEPTEEQSGDSRKAFMRHGPRMAGIFYRSCNFCGGVKFRVFKKVDVPFPNRIYGDLELSYPDVGKNLKLQYLECTGCRLVGINPLTRFDDINRNTFDGERNIVAWADIDYKEYAADKLNTIKLIYDQYEFERYRQTNRVLDVSCGPAVSLSWLRDVKGWKIFGIDPDRHSVRTAWDRYGVRIENGLIYDLEVPDEHFDLIVMDNSLEHTFDPLSTLLKAFRLLRKGGGLFIFTPNCHGLSTRFLDANAHWGHWFLYSPKTTVDVLRRIGYEVPKLFAIQNPVNPALIEKGIDLAPYREGLEVSLIGKEVVEDQIGKIWIYSDFFNLIAVKPANARLTAEGEAELLRISHSSLRQLENVEIMSGELNPLTDKPQTTIIINEDKRMSSDRPAETSGQLLPTLKNTLPPKTGPSGEYQICSVFVECNLCGGQESDVLYRDIPQVLTDSAVVACKRCGLKRLEPRMVTTQQLWSSTESYVYRDYIPLWSKLGSFSADGTFDAMENFRYWQRNVLGRVQGFRRTNRFLDVGCAIGLLVEAAGRAGWVATGVDISPPAVKYGVERFGVDLRVGQIHEFPFPEDYFDVINLWDVIEHVTDPLGTLKTVWGILRPGGALVIQTPNYAGVSRRILEKHWEMFATEHFFYFEQSTLKRMLGLAGFNEIEFETLGFDRSKLASVLGEDSEELKRLDEELQTGRVEFDTLVALAQKPTKASVIKEHQIATRFWTD